MSTEVKPTDTTYDRICKLRKAFANDPDWKLRHTWGWAYLTLLCGKADSPFSARELARASGLHMSVIVSIKNRETHFVHWSDSYARIERVLESTPNLSTKRRRKYTTNKGFTANE